MGRIALAFIEKNFADLFNQQYCACPCCGRSINAQPETVRLEIQTLIGSITLYRRSFYYKNIAKIAPAWFLSRRSRLRAVTRCQAVLNLNRAGASSPRRRIYEPEAPRSWRFSFYVPCSMTRQALQDLAECRSLRVGFRRFKPPRRMPPACAVARLNCFW